MFCQMICFEVYTVAIKAFEVLKVEFSYHKNIKITNVVLLRNWVRHIYTSQGIINANKMFPSITKMHTKKK